jgi:hypothetical protein
MPTKIRSRSEQDAVAEQGQGNLPDRPAGGRVALALASSSLRVTVHRPEATGRSRRPAEGAEHHTSR